MMRAPWRIADVGVRSRAGDRDTDRARVTTTRTRRRSRGGRFMTNRPSSIVVGVRSYATVSLAQARSPPW